jgi:hypothetical protein
VIGHFLPLRTLDRTAVVNLLKAFEEDPDKLSPSFEQKRTLVTSSSWNSSIVTSARFLPTPWPFRISAASLPDHRLFLPEF